MDNKIGSTVESVQVVKPPGDVVRGEVVLNMTRYWRWIHGMLVNFRQHVPCPKLRYTFSPFFLKLNLFRYIFPSDISILSNL